MKKGKASKSLNDQAQREKPLDRVVRTAVDAQFLAMNLKNLRATTKPKL